MHTGGVGVGVSARCAHFWEALVQAQIPTDGGSGTEREADTTLQTAHR